MWRKSQPEQEGVHIKGLVRYGVILASCAVISLAAINYYSDLVAPILSANVADDGCGQIQDADGVARPDPLDPDCEHGVWVGRRR